MAAYPEAKAQQIDAAAEALKQCDVQASDPDDPDREAPGVTDKQFVPNAAIRACKEAVRLNPNSAREWFQLGRAYKISISQRYDEKMVEARLDAIVTAVTLGYLPAMKATGDIYREGKDTKTAIEWYKKAAEAGYIPAETALQEMQAAIKGQTENSQVPAAAKCTNPTHARLGAEVGNIDKNKADEIGLSGTTGALVITVQPSSPAQAAGLRSGDVIQAIDGDPINDYDELVHKIGRMSPGKTVNLTIYRDGKKQTLPAKLSPPDTASLLKQYAPNVEEWRRQSGRHGAFAVDLECNRYGYSYDSPTPKAAREAAIRFCMSQGINCKVIYEK